jgi:hypothetical protein
MTHPIYDMHHGAICTVKRKGVVYMNWLDAWCAGRAWYGVGGGW